MISWTDIEVEYGEHRVLGPVSVSVAEGEWLGLIGPNGAGKSTLLKTAVGVAPHTGTVAMSGRERRRGLDIAWMPQRPHLPEEMGVADYVMLGRAPHLGYLAAETRHDVETVRLALEKLDLSEFARRPLGTLSGGEAQRAVLARALAQEAPVLLLDEPTASLDVGHAVEVLEVVDELRARESLTVVTAAHDLTLAGRYADRLLLMNHGSIVAEGTPHDVLTEVNLSAHYGAGIKVLDDVDGPVVVPVRRRGNSARPSTAD
ncbi:MAG TPA: ABC transporter ATP-binding protein [Acidimicrobiia bacterium]|nr:ABC transporter ATP-binding protein [Acidimicrobiia bacterium]